MRRLGVICRKFLRTRRRRVAFTERGLKFTQVPFTHAHEIVLCPKDAPRGARSLCEHRRGLSEIVELVTRGVIIFAEYRKPESRRVNLLHTERNVIIFSLDTLRDRDNFAQHIFGYFVIM